jgi:hypothetical protein
MGPANWWAKEAGTALLIVLTLTFLFSALTIGAATVVGVETSITSRYRDGIESLYIADGAQAVVLAELRTLPDWSPILQGTVHSTASQGSFTGSVSVVGGTLFLCCGGQSVFERLARESAAGAVPARRTLTWHPYLWSPWNALAGQPGQGRVFVLTFVQDDEDDGDVDAATDLNGVVVVRSEAIRPDGLRRVVEALVAREPGDPDHGIPAAVRVLRWRDVR